MTGIAGSLDVRRVGRRDYLTLAPVDFWVEAGKFTVPPGFRYDGGSIPSPAWSLVGCPFGGPGDYGYLLHDYFYRLDELGGAPVSRLAADNAMNELHHYCGMNPIQADGVYTVVRAMSWAFWSNGLPDVPVEPNDLDAWFLDG